MGKTWSGSLTSQDDVGWKFLVSRVQEYMVKLRQNIHNSKFVFFLINSLNKTYQIPYICSMI